jgi:hypothetical protein
MPRQKTSNVRRNNVNGESTDLRGTVTESSKREDHGRNKDSSDIKGHKDSPVTSDHEQKQNQINPRNWITIALNWFQKKFASGWVTAIATVGLFWVGYETNTTTRQAVDDARKHAHIELRAYVSAVKGELLGIDDNGAMRVRITVRNLGKTPAYETTIQSETWWEGEVAPVAAPITDGEKTTLASGDELYYFHPEQIEPSYRDKLKGGRAVLHVQGSVTYRDEFGEKREFPFHYVQGGKYDPNSPLMGVVSIDAQ